MLKIKKFGKLDKINITLKNNKFQSDKKNLYDTCINFDISCSAKALRLDMYVAYYTYLVSLLNYNVRGNCAFAGWQVKSQEVRSLVKENLYNGKEPGTAGNAMV